MEEKETIQEKEMEEALYDLVPFQSTARTRRQRGREGEGDQLGDPLNLERQGGEGGADGQEDDQEEEQEDGHSDQLGKLYRVEMLEQAATLPPPLPQSEGGLL